MIEVESNRHAWGMLAEDHYRHYRKRIEDGENRLNAHIREELGDLAGKRVAHLQCNVGFDTLALAEGAAHVTGVDLAPENVRCARMLAEDFGFANVDFVEADACNLPASLDGRYDVVFTSEGVLGWLPDLDSWARGVRRLLADGGFLYVFDSHPFYLAFDEAKLGRGEYDLAYPYFGKEPDVDDCIGGYASEPKEGVEAYFWMHPVSDILNALIGAGLRIDAFNEFPENFFDSGSLELSPEKGLYELPGNDDRFPMTFSLRASA
ncbi:MULTISPECIES: class I SAM-dependent methyltransferase [Gordonibacter]|uniref:Class I SAM-dependent methyltransferase n=1 Tax=Gordonibacter urolithinfaciens TaxID=1335613 RepID=A0A423UHE1_9ACTN|nr:MULTISPECIES: class I SAM-dependent methyltransferase [Gordonibacter]MDN4469507.1 class I SAM-dependent methyltransferase [Gordonibacter sp. RACS_AR68]ROT88000.1 class I SAM-dependent methyltransferase [Gordonibacter urolithinfaciens]ROT88242.1 class I SAM-dependent methyltransferase [Gordonibacter urolithinfaciens]GKG90957.1 methyltransferase [Gordonibacter pamelaeae]